MKIKILGAHNIESRNTRLVSLLIDGVLALDAGALTSTLSFLAQQKLKAVLLTHQHYDHIRDVPTIAMGSLLHETTINIYSTRTVYDALVSHLLNNKLYPNFMERPQDNPVIKFRILEPGKTEQIEGYSILAIPVNHSVEAVGFQVTAPDGKSVFYTGDTGPGLADCWRQISPQLIIIEVTAPDRYEEFARESKHLTPGLLKLEMEQFQKLKGYLPQVIAVHMNPRQEQEIETAIAVVARSLGNQITLGYEDRVVHL